MTFDLVIRNGTVVDGSGLARYRADVAIGGNRIVRIGRVDSRGATEIDADGHVVSPGFIDGHTHMDAQVFWDQLGTNSCWHGVTSVVMGNCGFTLAPSRPGEHKLVIDNLERAEDIAAEAMAVGINWSWESFPEYLDAVAATPKAINYAAQIGHSSLRTSVMGERAFGGEATDDDLTAMRATLRTALQAGAVGFTTSISDHHETPDGRPIASRSTSWAELATLVDTIGSTGAGVFQLAVDTARVETDDRDLAMTFYDQLRQLAVDSRVTTSYGLRRQHLAAQLDMFDQAAAQGGSMFGQCQSTFATPLYSFKTVMPFDHVPIWRTLRSQSEADQLRALRHPDARAQLVEETTLGLAESPPRRPLEDLVVLRGEAPYVTVGSLAAAHRCSPIEVLIDLAQSSALGQLYTVSNSATDEADLLTAMKHPRTVMTFSDSGAHVRTLSGGDLQTTLLAYWVRERQAFSLEEAIRMITLVPARAWHLRDRGLVREGMIADLNVFDPALIAPGLPAVADDLPSGARRITQRAVGIRATVVGGVAAFQNGEHTGELPGTLIRGALASG